MCILICDPKRFRATLADNHAASWEAKGRGRVGEGEVSGICLNLINFALPADALNLLFNYWRRFSPRRPSHNSLRMRAGRSSADGRVEEQGRRVGSASEIKCSAHTHGHTQAHTKGECQTKHAHGLKNMTPKRKREGEEWQSGSGNS